METTLQCRGDDSVVVVSGEITIDSSPDLLALLLSQFQTGNCESLTLDLYGVERVDTSGLAVLLEALKAARTSRRQFHLRGLRDRPRYLLEATGLLHFFHEAPL